VSVIFGSDDLNFTYWSANWKYGSVFWRTWKQTGFFEVQSHIDSRIIHETFRLVISDHETSLAGNLCSNLLCPVEEIWLCCVMIVRTPQHRIPPLSGYDYLRVLGNFSAHRCHAVVLRGLCVLNCVAVDVEGHFELGWMTVAVTGRCFLLGRQV
jgi:hypothetical protein